MGLKCLLGHDFGPPGVVREHEEDGNEMVITEREIQRCKRCGEEQIIAESTEVRAIMSEDDLHRDADDDRLLDPEETTGVDVDSSVENPADATGVPERSRETAETEAEAEAVTGTDGGTTSASTPASASAVDDASPEQPDEESNTSLLERAEEGFDDEPADPAEEDAVILDEADEKPPRKHGEWPDSSDVGDPTPRDTDDTGPSGAVSADGTDDAVDPDGTDVDTAADPDDPRSLADTAAEEDAELLGGGDTTESETQEPEPGPSTATADSSKNGSWPSHEDADADEGFAAGHATAGGPSMAYGNELTPSSNGESASNDDGYDTSYIDNTVEERDGDGTIVSAAPGTETPPPGAETEYYCPNCGHTRPLDSSLRSGDICPSCQSGYIAERAR
jgi:hypothetical protein